MSRCAWCGSCPQATRRSPTPPERNHLLREHGITPVPGNLDEPDTLEMLGGLAHDVVHFAPTPSQGTQVTRTAHRFAPLTKNFTTSAHLHQYQQCAWQLRQREKSEPSGLWERFSKLAELCD